MEEFYEHRSLDWILGWLSSACEVASANDEVGLGPTIRVGLYADVDAIRSPSPVQLTYERHSGGPGQRIRIGPVTTALVLPVTGAKLLQVAERCFRRLKWAASLVADRGLCIDPFSIARRLLSDRYWSSIGTVDIILPLLRCP